MAFQTTFPLDWGQKQQDEFSVTYQSSQQSKKGHLSQHWHDCFEILYITQGGRSFTAGAQSLFLQTGDILVIPPHLTHSSTGGIYESIVLGYAESVIHTPYNSFSGLHYLLPFRNAQALHINESSPQLLQLQQLLRRGYDTFVRETPVRSLELRACILQIHAIIWQLYLQSHCAAKGTCSYLQDIQNYIELHIAGDISPYEIANALHISHSHLCRIVRDAFHTTPSALINQYRLCLAQQLLTQHPELSIAEVSLHSGFADSSYFIRLFKKENGITPRQFRLQYSAEYQ